jgi:hypothetical protein
MRRLAIASMLAAVALATAPAAHAADIGANDDTGKFAPDGGAAFYARMAAMGLRQTILTVRWRPSEPDVIQHRDFLDRAVPGASSRGIRVVFAVYPYPPRELEIGVATPTAFAAYLTTLAERYPDVRQYVVGNEPNQPAFWRPQLAPTTGKVLSAARFGTFLAAGYDALKAVDPGITVVGVGLSPRGNDNPRARTNRSTSPVRFLSALGAWYRRSGRRLPLMDGFSYHPYPWTASDAPTRRYAWPNAGFADLDRVKQALWDAFHGTPQPTTADGLRLYLDEVGWQVDTLDAQGYTGLENVATTGERRQAAIYGRLVRLAACDPQVAQLNFFGFYDDSARDTGFQSALHRVDGTPRMAAGSVAAAIAATSAGCTGLPVRWRPALTVSGASLTPWRLSRSGGIKVLVGAREGASAVVCMVARATATSRVVTSVRAIERQAVAPCWRGRLTPRTRVQVAMTPPPWVTTPVSIVARIAAEANPARAALLVVQPERGVLPARP